MVASPMECRHGPCSNTFTAGGVELFMTALPRAPSFAPPAR